MEWQALVLGVQILLLATGWHLFQRARGELAAKAAETPILGEVKQLQAQVQRLLHDIEDASDEASRLLETRCLQARELQRTLEARLAEIEEARARWQNEIVAEQPRAFRPHLSLETSRAPRQETGPQEVADTETPPTPQETIRETRRSRKPENASRLPAQTLRLVDDPVLVETRRDEMCYNQAESSAAVVGTAAASPALDARERLRREVFALADTGQTTVEIARATGLSQGEIETMLGLRAASLG